MEPKYQTMFDAIPRPPEGSTFTPEKVEVVCFPHPYCITPRHVEWASDHHGGRLTEHAIEESEKRGAKCGMKDCQLSYGQHEQNVTLFVRVPIRLHNLKDVPGLHEWLMSVKDKASEVGIQGFAFPWRSA